jgi:ribonuclease P protein component
VYASGTRFRLGPFTIFVLVNKLDNPRICISIAKKYIAKAIMRNTMKRLIRESFRLNKATIQHMDIVITVNCAIEKNQLPVLKEQLNKIWARLQL